MKTLQILCLLAILSFATGCKKEIEKTTTIEQTEQGTLPDATAADTVKPGTDTIAVKSTDTVK